ncbi:MAG: hypothetical protein R2856_14810 [Caldilineaceae bacterium]
MNTPSSLPAPATWTHKRRPHGCLRRWRHPSQPGDVNNNNILETTETWTYSADYRHPGRPHREPTWSTWPWSTPTRLAPQQDDV